MKGSSHDRRRFLKRLASRALAVAALASGSSPARDRTQMWGTAAKDRPLNKTGFVTHDRYIDHVLFTYHPESPDRIRAIRRRLGQTGLDKQVVPLPLLDDPLEHIRQIHCDDHIRNIMDMEETGEIAALAAAGALGGAKAVCEGTVLNAFCALRPPGHHATDTGQEEGFCFFNNIAIAARYCQRVHNIERVLIVDWDFHHGNGTEWAFYEDPTVLFFSTHNQRAYPGTGSPSKKGKGAGLGYNINVHLGCRCTDREMIEAWKTHLLPAAKKFQPQIVLISAGFDSRVDDPLGCFDVTDAGFVTLTKMAMQIASEHAGGRVVSFLEGGYNVEGLAGAVCAHIRTLLGTV
jgi:acetoin utilization deacetylase AcuC-like enzyme